MARIALAPLARLLLAARGALAGLTVDIEDPASVKAAAALVAEDLLSYYHGDEPTEVPGILPPVEGDSDDGYYWWTGAALWDGLLDYRSRTGDSKYDEIISQGMGWQVGEEFDFLPRNWSASAANDDQLMWALSAVTATETGFQELGGDNPKWIEIAQNVFDDMVLEGRRIEGDCKGGLRWQIVPFNSGYNYTSSFGNILFLNLAARLGHLTNNESYSNAAMDSYLYLTQNGLVADGPEIYDGFYADDCQDVVKLQTSHTYAFLIQGSAFMFNHTNEDTWKTLLDDLLDQTLDSFFSEGVAVEPSCESSYQCNSDTVFFKGQLHKALRSAAEVAPHTADKIMPVLKSSAKAAAAQCTSGDNSRMCGFHWSTGRFDGMTGAAEQLNVLSALVSVLPSGADANSPSGGSPQGQDSQGGNQGDNQGDTPGSIGSRTSVGLSALVGSLLLGSLLL